MFVDSTPALPWLALFLLIGFGIFACVGDSITTITGLTAGKGFREANPIARWMFEKVGQTFAGFLTTGAYAIIAGFIASKNWGAGMFFAGAIAATETYMTIKNYLLLKKLGIKV